MGAGSPGDHLTDWCYDLNRACPLSLSSPTCSVVLPGLALGVKRDPAPPVPGTALALSKPLFTSTPPTSPPPPRCLLSLGLPIYVVSQVDFRITDSKVPSTSELWVLCPLQSF